MGKLWAIVRSGFYGQLNSAAVGFEVRKPGFLVQREPALAYALACDDPNPAYTAEQGAYATPLYASRILADVLEEVLFYPKLRVNMVKLVHAEQSFTWSKPLKVGMEVVPVARVVAIREVSSGQILDVDVALEENGVPVVMGRSSMFIRGKPKRDPNRPKEPKPAEPEMAEVSKFRVALDQPKRYATASGDYNPIHRNKLVAKLAGFDRPIAHGLCVMAMTVRELMAAYGQNDPARLHRVSLRFAKPVYPGKELTLKAMKDGTTVKFGVELKPGKWAISNGEAEFK